MLELLFNIVAGLEDCNCIKKRIPTQLLCYEYCKFFKNTYFEEYLRTADSLLLIITSLIKYWRPLLNQEHNMEWFLLRRFINLLRIYFLLIVSRNHSNRVKYCSDIRILTNLCRLLSTT